MSEELHKPGGGGEKAGFSPTPKQIAGGVIAVLLLIVALQNSDEATVKILLFDVTTQLWIVLVGFMAVSFLVGVLVGGRRAKASAKGKKKR